MPAGAPGGELGMFGPGSVTWRVQADPVVLLGGLRALLLQATHPRTMAGVSQNSVFHRDPWGRLARTAEYVTTVAFGTEDEALRAAARVRGIHRRVRATDPATGEVYPVDDPDLLRWVHVCETESLLTTVCRAGVALTATEQDDYYAEQVRAAELIGLDPATVPASAAEVAAYYEAMRPALRVGADAAEAAAFVLWPPMPPPLWLTPARPGWAGVAGLAFALLPAWARRLYGGLGLPVGDATATVALRSLHRFATALPTRFTRGPLVRAALARADAAAA